MTRAEMEQLKRLPDEIKAIDESIRNPRIDYVNVFYKDYRTGKGIPKSRSEFDTDQQELKRLRKKLRRKAEELGRLIVKAEKFIEGIKDSETRTILRSYYINGQTQDAVASQLNYDRSTVAKKIDRFWSEQNNSHNSH